MKQHWPLAALGLVAYLLFMLVLTPAAWWLKLVSLPPQLQLGQVTGTLWQGKVQQLRFQQLQLNELNWQLNPWSLLRLRLDLALQSGSVQQNQQPYLQARVWATPAGISVHSSLIKLPVPLLLPLLQLPMPVQAGGELVLDIQRLTLQSGRCQTLAGQLSWFDASLQPPTGTWLQLQQFTARLECDQQQPVLITDPANILALDVRATVNAAGKLQVSGTLKPAAELPAEVHQAMQFVGAPDAEGRYRLNF
ncbi:MAG: type II secretion system protein N [Alishewanella aestuarii]